MKTLRTILALVVLMPLLSGCDKFKEERFSTTIPITFEIDKLDTDPLVVDLDGTITALINDELNKYKEEIKRYELVSVTYKVWEYYGTAGVVFDGSIGFGNVNMSAPGVSAQFNDIDLQTSFDNPNQTQFPFNSQDVDKIEQYFLDTNGMRLWLDGDVSDVPVHFVLAITVNVDAIAEVED
ncbi:MAG: hypothetical protein ACKVOR_03450 [Flavobacteriales bacterium]